MPQAFSHLRSLHRALSLSDSENEEVAASAVAPESLETHEQADIIEHASSESFSPPGPFDSPPHRRQKLDHMWRHSVPDYQVRPVASSASSSTLGTMDADTSLRPTKWGRCHMCGYSMKPHMFASGRYAGSLRLLCSRFWQYEDNKRLCWNSTPLEPEMWSKVPTYLRKKHSQIVPALLRNGQGTNK